jgi:hypothetical protein
MITLLREFEFCVTFIGSMRYYIFNLIFMSTLERILWGINSDFNHVGFVSLDAVG